MFVLLAAFVLLGPAVMPWYLLWALPFAAVLRFGPWLVLTGASGLTYLIYVDGVERAWWIVLEYAVFGAALLVWRRFRDR